MLNGLQNCLRLLLHLGRSTSPIHSRLISPSALLLVGIFVSIQRQQFLVDTIINNIYKNIYRFSKNDKIIISNTLETRFNIPDALSKNILDFNGGHIIYHNEIPEYELFHLGKDIVNDLLVRYTVDTRQMYLKSWKKHYENKFLEVGKALKKLGYEVYFWPFEIWLDDKTQFERIREATNEKLIDGHFSEAGHIAFFKFLSSNLNKFRL